MDTTKEFKKLYDNELISSIRIVFTQVFGESPEPIQEGYAITLSVADSKGWLKDFEIKDFEIKAGIKPRIFPTIDSAADFIKETVPRNDHTVKIELYL